MSRQRKIQQDSPARDFVLPGIFGYPSPVSFFLRYAGGQFYLQVANPRSTAEEVARLLHTNEDGVSHLVTVKLLKPVGHPTGNKQKFFCTEELLCLMRDRAWLSKVTDALYAFNEQKNAGTQWRNLERQAKRGPAAQPPPNPNQPTTSSTYERTTNDA
jgi:hypothetical protein